MTTGQKNHHKGFTLIELMVVIAVLSILTAIAVPAYGEYVMRSKRAEATAGLLSAASWLERVSTSTGAYLTTSTLPAELASTKSGAYVITYSTPNSGRTYTLTATPQGGQAGDKCGNFTLNNQSQEGVSGSLTPATCWSR